MAEEKNKKEEAKKEEKKTEEKETEKEEEKKVEVPEKFKKLVKEIEEMSVLDLAELVKILEDKFGVSAAPQVVAGAAAGGAAAGGAEEKEEKSAYNIVITELGSKKIQVIKAIRDVTKKGLKDSKALADAIASEPQTIQEGVEKKEAEEIKKKFEEAGAKVELK